MFSLYVKDRRIRIEINDILVSDSVNVYPVHFKFSHEWNELTKTVMFRTLKGKTVENVFEILLNSSSSCNIPWELLLEYDRILEVGIYGTKGNDLILNTLWTPLGKINEGSKNIDNANHPEEPTPDIYQQIISQIGNLDDLQTDEKSSIVGSINEVYNKIGSGSESGISYGIGHGLKIVGGDLTVNTVDNFMGDNTLPMTAAGVQTTVGNIESLLETI